MTTVLLRFILLCCTLLLFSCREDKSIHITGELKNIPDGEMIFYTRDRKTGKVIPIDSCSIVAGRFNMILSAQKYPESIWVYVDHKEKSTDTTRFFTFLTNLKYRGAPLKSAKFYLEDGIKINGSVYEVNFKNHQPKKLLKHASIDTPLIVGKQTQVAYNDTIDFGSLTEISQIRQAIQKHPYSYYYLYKLEERVHEFSNESFLSLLQCFDSDVQQSQTGQELLSYVKNRKNKSLTFETKMENESGQRQIILDKKASYNLVVLWASWCGPCRKEIPDLKDLYTRIGSEQKLHLVSISLDEDRTAWLNALRKEKMPWSQLVVPSDSRQYMNEIFQFDGNIPTMLLFDKEGKVLKKLVGYEKDNLSLIKEIIYGNN